MTKLSLTLTKAQARRIILHAAGLTKRGQFGRGKEAVYKLIDELGFVQLDTNYVDFTTFDDLSAAIGVAYDYEVRVNTASGHSVTSAAMSGTAG